MAAKNNNGFVIAQVERIADLHTLNPKLVRSPAFSWTASLSPGRKTTCDLFGAVQSWLQRGGTRSHGLHRR